MNPFVTTLLLTGLGLGTTITLSSSHWLLAWMGLEINTLAIIPLMARRHHPRAAEAATKYFLAQATASAMILFAGMTNAWITGEWHTQQVAHPLPTTMITLAIALKIGLAPLHSWLPEVLQGLELATGLILSTWQKLAPFAILFQIQPTSPDLLMTMGLLSTLIGGWAGLNQTQLRKILAYSSIAHLGWAVLILQLSPSIALLTLIIYFIMTFSTFMVFKLNNAMNINSLATSWTKVPIMAALSPLILLSLGGLPPLSGFMPKWLILEELTKQEMGAMATMVALSALLSLYFYLRLSYAMALTMFPLNITASAPWRFIQNQLSLPLAISTTLTILLLPMTPTTTSLLTL
uniref:NADH-ubiquinone oxidoreductase chain 2 n=1 Tax=Zebrias quagga TaxID=367194 RepID=V9IMY8_ZEBQU|nr:NADH dehydrogenase subunit 2 [Zebrias quagga]AFB71222.1 NADH dehydrogenase subunit 2 [Zebrias quagga]